MQSTCARRLCCRSIKLAVYLMVSVFPKLLLPFLRSIDICSLLAAKIPTIFSLTKHLLQEKSFLSFGVLIFTRENISHFPCLGETGVADCASLLINVQP